MSFLASLIPAGISLASSLFGGKDRQETQVQTQPASAGTPGFIMDAGANIADFVKKFLPQYDPGAAYTGQLNAPMTAEEQRGTGFLNQFLDAAIDPTAAAAATNLQDTLSGKYNPYTSPYFAGLKDEAYRAQERAIDALNRESSAGGDFFTSSRVRGVSDIATDTANKLTTTLGGLYESERGRQIQAAQIAPSVAKFISEYPLRKVEAASVYGSIPRLIQQAAYERNYNEWTRRQSALGGVAGTGTSLVSGGSRLELPSSGTVTRYAPSTFERVTGAVNGILQNSPGFFNDLISQIGGLFA